MSQGEGVAKAGVPKKYPAIAHIRQYNRKVEWIVLSAVLLTGRKLASNVELSSIAGE